MTQHPCSLGLRGPLALSGPVWVVCTFHTSRLVGDSSGWGSFPGWTQLLQRGPELREEAMWHYPGRAQAAPEVGTLSRVGHPATPAPLPCEQRFCLAWGKGETGRLPWHPDASPAPPPPPGCRDPAQGAGPAPSARVSSSASPVSQLQRERPQV